MRHRPVVVDNIFASCRRYATTMNALRGLALLLLFQAIGEAIAHGLALPIPGPVVGLMLLLVGLRVPATRTPIGAAADVLLGNLSLLFVPVGVGVITHLDVVAQHGVALLVLIVVSTWLGMAVTALVLRAMLAGADRRTPRSTVDG